MGLIWASKGQPFLDLPVSEGSEQQHLSLLISIESHLMTDFHQFDMFEYFYMLYIFDIFGLFEILGMFFLYL